MATSRPDAPGGEPLQETGILQEQLTPGSVPVLKWQHIAAATIGNVLEFYDFLVYAFFSIQIGQAFSRRRVPMGV